MTIKEEKLHSFRSALGNKIPISGQLIIVTTVDEKNHVNAALKSDFMRMVSSPPILAFSCNLVHHTAQNILKTHEFVVNIVGEHILEQALETSKDYPKGVNELNEAGLTGISSQIVTPPRILECPVHLECIEESHKTYDDEIIFFGKALAVSFDEDFFQASCEERCRIIRCIFPLGEKKYACLGNVKHFPG
jgi:flavin reductase (DIM6/NTAB) family NADH-FMN oxidoreductase RutF